MNYLLVKAADMHKSKQKASVSKKILYFANKMKQDQRANTLSPDRPKLDLTPDLVNKSFLRIKLDSERTTKQATPNDVSF